MVILVAVAFPAVSGLGLGDTSKITVSVSTRDLSGNPITGIWAVIRHTNGTTIASGFTPVSFAVPSGTAYVVHLGSFKSYAFSHWGNGNATSYYALAPDLNASLVGYYVTPPLQPTGLAAAPASPLQMGLSWIPPASNGGSPITGYEIERAKGDLSFGSFSNSTGMLFFSYANKTSFNDTGLAPSTTYNYTVFAINLAGPGPHSNITSGTTPIEVPPPPVGLFATPVSYSQIDLSWTSPPMQGYSNLMGFQVERSSDGGSIWSTIISSTGSGATSYNDTGLTPDRTYQYRVSAINQAGVGLPSLAANATTPSATPGPNVATTGIIEPLYCDPYGNDDSPCPANSPSGDCSIYPGDFCWQPIVDAHLAHPRVPFTVVVNPLNGPCRSTNNPCDYNVDIGRGIRSLAAAGIKVLGYVATHYAKIHRSPTCCPYSDAQGNITQWADLYKRDGVTGINLDEMSTVLGPGNGNVTFYQNLTGYAKSLGFDLTVGNPGIGIRPQYVYGNAADVFTIFEGRTAPTLDNLSEGALVDTVPVFDKSRFAFVSFCQPSLPSPEMIGNQSSFVSVMYYTDVGDSCTPSDTNPYDRIPSYLSALAADLDRPSATVTIDTVDSQGRPIKGFFVAVTQNGTQIPSPGFAPFSFLGSSGVRYTFTPEGYAHCGFDHWNDNLSDNAARAVLVGANNTQITAVFSGPGCP